MPGLIRTELYYLWPRRQRSVPVSVLAEILRFSPVRGVFARIPSRPHEWIMQYLRPPGAQISFAPFIPKTTWSAPAEIQRQESYIIPYPTGIMYIIPPSRRLTMTTMT
jgi:hypothetical protein